VRLWSIRHTLTDNTLYAESWWSAGRCGMIKSRSLRAIGGIVGVGVLAMVAGLLDYQTLSGPSPNSGERPRRAGQNAAASKDSTAADRLITRHAATLLLDPEIAKRAAPPPPPADAIDTVRFSGLVEKAGVPMAVFLIETAGDQRMVSVKQGGEVVPAWHLKSIDRAGAVLEKAGVERKLSLFD
jgi:hypothetical protein